MVILTRKLDVLEAQEHSYLGERYTVSQNTTQQNNSKM
jgi:hypothetical protein